MITGTSFSNVKPINLKQSDIAFEAEVHRECLQKREHIMKEIEIKNVGKWDSAKAKDFVSNKVTSSQVMKS